MSLLWRWQEFTSRQDGDVAEWLNKVEQSGKTVLDVTMAYNGEGRISVVAKVGWEPCGEVYGGGPSGEEGR